MCKPKFANRAQVCEKSPMKFLPILLVCVCVVSGCRPPEKPDDGVATLAALRELSKTPGRYSYIQASAQGEAVLLDTATGRFWLLHFDNEEIRPLGALWIELPHNPFYPTNTSP